MTSRGGGKSWGLTESETLTFNIIESFDFRKVCLVTKLNDFIFKTISPAAFVVVEDDDDGNYFDHHYNHWSWMKKIFLSFFEQANTHVHAWEKMMTHN